MSPDPPLDALLAGRYRLRSVLGKGGMATVYRADDLLEGRQVAVKVLAADLVRDAATLARFVREMRLAASLGGAHVAQVVATDAVEVSWCENDPRTPPYFVMELVDGPDLGALLRAEGPLSVARAVRLVVQVLDGLSLVHAAGVVHRDLKPENVLVAEVGTRRERAKLCDFGIATLRGPILEDDELTPAGRSMATPHYATPEQIRGDRGRQPSVDVYAAAVVLYELVAGARPFEAPSFVELCERIRDEPPTPLRAFRDDVPFALDAVIARALAKRAEQRYPSAVALREALLAAVSSARE
jgi:serine/threonine-protein kinase